MHGKALLLYCPNIGAAVLSSGFQDGVSQIWLRNLRCNGSELRLIDCPASALGDTRTCPHSQDAGVRCRESTIISIIFVNAEIVGHLVKHLHRVKPAPVSRL